MNEFEEAVLSWLERIAAGIDKANQTLAGIKAENERVNAENECLKAEQRAEEERRESEIRAENEPWLAAKRAARGTN
jgi:hypothetical protein